MHPAEQRVHDDVRTFGWHIIKVPDGEPEFAYTIGLFHNFGHPELLIVGLPVAEVAHPVLNALGDEIRAGRRFASGDKSDAALEGYPVTFRPLPLRARMQHLGFAFWFYGARMFQALQVVYPDRDGHWPWAPEATDDFRETQPVFSAPGSTGRRIRNLLQRFRLMPRPATDAPSSTGSDRMDRDDDGRS